MIDKESWERLEANNAAKIIQNCWKSHVDRKIFGFYKNLVGFHTSKLVHTLFGDKVTVEENFSLSKKFKHKQLNRWIIENFSCG